jgi:cytochrome c
MPGPARLNGSGDGMAKDTVMMRSMMAAATLIVASAATAAAQDVAKGQQAFGLCRACHQIGEDAQNMLGPKSGIVWTEATFKQYIKNPAAMVPGTKMTFVGINDEQKIADLWAYVSQFNEDGTIKKK